jgi:2-oxoglutarate dehydrogenase E2 component (dihydrolipoamide succinyltransferase)
MSVTVSVPTLGESVTEAIVSEWLKKVGDFVEQDEILVELETDKITVAVPAPVSGVIKALKAASESTVNVGDVIAEIEPGARTEAAAPAAAATAAPAAQAKPAPVDESKPLSPAVARLVEENKLDPNAISATGPGGRILKGDVIDHLEAKSKPAPAAPAARPVVMEGDEPVERVKMTKLRQTVARRLVEAQQTAAMLTTFNEVDMSAVMNLRKQYQDAFVKKYGIKLGFMSFFVKAAVEALKEFPAVNAEIDGDEIVYKNFYHIGVAVGGGKGLVVPVVRHADRLGFAETEQEITRLAKLAMDNKLSLADLQGGTFTISNGGIYGSMMSTPILNPPQVGILGMHNITERAVVVDGKIEIRPMMYLALSYDHRIIDGKEAVSFLVRLKQCIENPERILLEV